jgi:hypothetical protein
MEEQHMITVDIVGKDGTGLETRTFKDKPSADKYIMTGTRDDVQYYRITIPGNTDLNQIFPDREPT